MDAELKFTCTMFPQIADFGLSNLYHKDKLLQTFCGSPLYASPEIVNGRPYRGPEVSHWQGPQVLACEFNFRDMISIIMVIIVPSRC